MKVLAALIGGFILASLAAILVSVGFRAPGYGAGAFFIAWIAAFAVALGAATSGKAWRRLLISSAVLSFMLPLAGVLFTGGMLATSTEAQHSGAHAAGMVIGGGLISGLLGFVGFFAGLVFLVIGLLVGRGKEIVYVERVPR